MVYKWEGKEAECYRLYVEEKKSMDEVIQYWKEKGFTPSKRAFQTQFKRWEFPLKHRRAHNEPEVIARIKELWEAHTMQKDMLRILAEEGYELNHRELMRIRAKHDWLLRARSYPSPSSRKRQKSSDARSAIEELQEAAQEDGGQVVNEEADNATPEADLSTNLSQKRQERFEKLQAESDERWRTKKRRRRIRGYAGLPADPEGPPRFPSETTLDEAKAYLNLDNDTYRQVRDEFQAICEHEGVIKKTICGPEKWLAVKQRLIAENSHLNALFFGAHIHPQEKPTDIRDVSVDVICSDVTKRMRVFDKKMTLMEAKSIIGVNPEQAREIRHTFFNLLKAHHFINKLAEGSEAWNAVKKEWIDQTELLQKLLAQGPSDPEWEKKQKAIEILCRDVMKRWRDQQVKLDPSRRKGSNTGPGPGPAKPRMPEPRGGPSPATSQRPTTAQISTSGLNALAATTVGNHDFQIDPSLLLAAASDPSILQDVPSNSTMGNFPTDTTLNTFQSPQAPSSASASTSNTASQLEPSPPQPQPQTQPQQTLFPDLHQVEPPVSAPIPAYFRIHPHSPLQIGPRIWLGTIRNGTVAEIKQQALLHHPSAIVLRIEGVVKDGLAAGQEISYPIDEEVELGGYLAHVAGGKVTFVVKLGAGYQ